MREIRRARGTLWNTGHAIMNHSLPLTAAFLVALLLSGCGQKGPLYLPGDPSEVQTEIPEIPEIESDEPPAGEENEDGEDSNESDNDN
jgi:predicted small lipoprotein YifL